MIKTDFKSERAESSQAAYSPTKLYITDLNIIVIYHTYWFSQVNTKTYVSGYNIANEEKCGKKSFLLSLFLSPLWDLNEDSISYSIWKLCSENINMTNLNCIIENLNGSLSCNLFSNALERPFEVALILLI